MIFGTIGSEPKWTEARTEGRKGCFVCRFGEPMKNQPASETVWFTMKDYVTPFDQMPAYQVGDFVQVSGALKPAPYMNRQNQPSVTLYLNLLNLPILVRRGGVNVSNGASTPATRQASVATSKPVVQEPVFATVASAPVSTPILAAVIAPVVAAVVAVKDAFKPASDNGEWELVPLN